MFFGCGNSLLVPVSFSIKIIKEGVCSRNNVWCYLLWLMFPNGVCLLDIFKSGSDVVIPYLLVFVFLVFFSVLQNDHFLQLLITDDVETAAIMMSVLHNILRVNRLVVFISLIFLNFQFKTRFLNAW